MKSLFSLLTDSMLFLGVVGLLSIAFLVTFALSPISYEDSALAKIEDTQVLGVLDTNQLQFRNLGKNTNSFHIETLENTNSYKASMVVSDIVNRGTAYDLAMITNESNRNKTLRFELKTPEADSQLVHFELKINGELYEIFPSVPLDISMNPDSTNKAAIIFSSPEQIHYAINCEIEIKAEN